MLPLRVDPDGLRRASGQMETLANSMATTSSASETCSSWLATSAAVSIARTDAKTAQTVLAERMQTTSQKLSAASAAYTNSDVHLAAKLRETIGAEAD